MDKLIPKSIWNCKGPRRAKMNLWKKNKIGRLILLYFKAPGNEMVWYWHMNRHADQWSRMERSEWAALLSADCWHGDKTFKRERKVLETNGTGMAGEELGRPWHQVLGQRENHETLEDSTGSLHITPKPQTTKGKKKVIRLYLKKKNHCASSNTTKKKKAIKWEEMHK